LLGDPPVDRCAVRTTDDLMKLQADIATWPALVVDDVRLAAARCLDAAYMEMRTSRLKVFPPPPGAPDPVEQLKRYCAAEAPR
jgi:hypothetical protein